MRPMSLEAAAGKNPVSHVGKLYNVIANIIANRVYNEVKGVKEVYVNILSQIGKPVNEPQIVDIKIVPIERLTSDMVGDAKSIAEETMNKVSELTYEIIENKIQLF
jgi:S-adenosylmethionine synthetase